MIAQNHTVEIYRTVLSEQLVSSVSHHALSKAPSISSYAASLAAAAPSAIRGTRSTFFPWFFPAQGAGLWASKTLEGHSHPCPASNKPRSRKITAWHMSDVNYQCLELFKNVMPLKDGSTPGKSLEVTDG
ncbi:hypothetical protein EVAR_76973_1 [Eumeta japonica]|uniref:Uncharacterized protein n=1 Tax=Eumeta variegata TaxID=151549 RepID=A0A4C1SF81_EUMVA|nr:hypothetical protein EVAR_76973_1 [Eumeta japonica]